MPHDCDFYPEYKDEIFESYVDHTTFTSRVWVNYDAAMQKFFMDPRAQDCGKLGIDPGEQQAFRRLGREGLQIKRLTLSLGTPFTTLCTVELQVKPDANDADYSRVIARLRPSPGSNGHRELLYFCTEMCADISRKMRIRQNGLRINSVEKLAKMFYKRPTVQEYFERNAGFRESPWMSLEDLREWNDAWVDFRAMGKGCS